ncbi:UDP-N-acetylmuramoyl-tripeptide--D-alanyl-D-alanine ligase [Candidatus Neptunochlamydia vexilliferae]|nr:Mur ligase family protein [Candidatus Neptunochlamydia vexilliferae]
MRKSVKEIAAILESNSTSMEEVVQTAIDSGEVEKDSLFFALKGERVDGHQFLEEVAKKGGVAAVVSKAYQGKDFGLELIRVDDVNRALHFLAKEMFKETKGTVIGVTGTVGKTTTKEFLATVLGERFRVMKSEASLNSQVGLPLTILNGDLSAEVIVLEMGMSEKGELKRLVDIVHPHIGILTKLTLVHGNPLEEIAEEKCQLFTSKRMERAFLNEQTASFEPVQNLTIPKEWFDKAPGPFTESHLLEAVGAAVAIARYLGMTEKEIERGVQKLKPFDHRFEKIEKKGALFIDDSYNASPEAVKTALSNLPKGKRRIALLGAMKELGPFEVNSHREVAEHALPLVDHLLCVGKECLPMVDVFEKGGKPVELFHEKAEVASRLKELVQKEDVVLIKGSNSLKLWTLLEGV